MEKRKKMPLQLFFYEKIGPWKKNLYEIKYVAKIPTGNL
jgi:hypothetical protein